MGQASYFSRSLEPTLKEAADQFPAVVLTGPRQSGKTTVLRRLFASYSYQSLELPDVRAAATSDPRAFLESFPPPVIFDEVQYAAELLPYIKERIDASRDLTGQYILSGSQNLLLLEQVTESLAGRAAVLRLLPLSSQEAAEQPRRVAPWWSPVDTAAEAIAAVGPGSRGPAFGALWGSLLRGGYPELVAQPDRNIQMWHASYLQTYVERDVRMLRQVGDLSLFQNFLRMLAARSGQLLNLSDVGRDLGLAANTCKAWLSVLEASYMLFVIRPFFANVGKRLVKRPKVFLTDVGMLCYLSGLRDAEHAAAGPMGGAILETAVLSQIMRTLVHRGEEPRVFFWRTSAGAEVDFIVETGGGLVPIEVKSSATPRPPMAKGIHSFQEDLGARAGAGYVVHPGDVRLPLGSRVLALPFADL